MSELAEQGRFLSAFAGPLVKHLDATQSGSEVNVVAGAKFLMPGRQCEPWIPIEKVNETKMNLLLLLQDYDSAERTPLG